MKLSLSLSLSLSLEFFDIRVEVALSEGLKFVLNFLQLSI